ncbi:MAG: LuxR C-terminal-related transcriptional regulator [Trueperaceae bacterium]
MRDISDQSSPSEKSEKRVKLASGRNSGLDPGVASGFDALAQGAWQEARAAFETELERGEAPEAFEGLGMAAWWLDDSATTFSARERSYLLPGARRAQAGCPCSDLAGLGLSGVPWRSAVSNGWLQRAHRLLEGHESSPEYGWLLLQEGELALLYENDTAKAKKNGRAAAELGRHLAQFDLEMVGLALEGLVLVTEGRVPEGMQQLDEATAAAVAGELTDLNAIGATCCYTIYACERVQDYGRATQWCSRVTEFCERWQIRSLLAVCRTHLANVLVWRGAWKEAEDMLVEATSELAATRPARSFEGFMRLGELRRRQGRWDEAESLFQEHSFHPFTQLGSAALELDRGNSVHALDLAQRFLRNLSSSDRTSRATALEVLARAQVALGDLVHAVKTVDELTEVAELIDTLQLNAALRLSKGLLKAAQGEPDEARALLEDAVDLYTRSGAPFEAGRARLELAKILEQLGRERDAAREAHTARDAFGSLGAQHEARRAAAILGRLEGETPGRDQQLVTPRELEILNLIAQGYSNREIAKELSVSVHTVHRHVANILTKHGLSSRAAAVAFAHENDLL